MRSPLRSHQSTTLPRTRSPRVSAHPTPAVVYVHAVAPSDIFRHSLQKRFGVDDFRPWQREVIDALLVAHRQVLVVAPTGGGKSLCYQFPATELEGTTIVISPLIALMEDQVRGLEARGIAATWLASSVDKHVQREREEALRAGRYKLLYLAPERLTADTTMALLQQLRPQFIAVDEAHCISQWGHDFRPDYLRVGEMIETLKPKHVLACTATATPLVREEILTGLRLPKADTMVVLRGFARPNLHLSAEFVETAKERQVRVLDALSETIKDPKEPCGAAIIYAATRKGAEQMGAVVQEAGYRTAVYHAGLDADTRARSNRFFSEGKVDVVVATNAFGMGIDRPDIRLVLHIQSPGSIESYYQEVGRAGRDGQPAHGILLASMADFGLRRRLLELNHSADEMVRPWKLFLDLMRYAEAGSCRHDFILRYFEDEQELLGGCGHCDVCEALEQSGEATTDGALVNENDALIVRKALAGVARVQARVGLTSVAEMLQGAQTARLKRLRLEGLSTYGLLKDYSREWIIALLRRCITAGLIELAGSEFPVAQLTHVGWDVMQSKTPVRVLLPGLTTKTPKKKGAPRDKQPYAKRPTQSAPAAELAPGDQMLFDALRVARLDLAKTKGVPAYVICHDRTLREIAVAKPLDHSALGTLHGMGPARMEALADRFLSVVHEVVGGTHSVL